MAVSLQSDTGRADDYPKADRSNNPVDMGIVELETLELNSEYVLEGIKTYSFVVKINIY